MTRNAAIGEILYVLACVLVTEWVVPPRLLKNLMIFATPILLIVGFGLASHLRHGETARDLGLRTDNFISAARVLAWPMLAFFIVMALTGWFAGTLICQSSHVFSRLLHLSLWLPVWGFLQQYALHAIINRRAQVVWGRGMCSVLIVGVLFAALHLPNPRLTLATLAGGIVWSYAYQRTPNLFALALSHWLMTVVLISTWLGSVERGMKVGAGFLGW